MSENLVLALNRKNAELTARVAVLEEDVRIAKLNENALCGHLATERARVEVLEAAARRVILEPVKRRMRKLEEECAQDEIQRRNQNRDS